MMLRHKIRRAQRTAWRRIEEIGQQIGATDDRDEQIRLHCDRLAIATEHEFLVPVRVPKAMQKALAKGQQRATSE